MFAVLLHYVSLRFACCFFLTLCICEHICALIEMLSIKFTSKGKREFVPRDQVSLYLFIISTNKLVVSRNFLSIRIVLSCFYLFIFYVEIFSTWIWRLPFAVYVKLKFSNEISHVSLHKNNVKSMSLCCCHYRISQLEDALKRNQYELEKAAEEQQVI